MVDATIDRNAFGAQADSFQTTLEATSLQREFPGVFIRAPRFTQTGPEGEVAAMLGEEVVGVKTGNRLALTFHPELSSDVGFHRWLIETASALTAEA
jgi:5'-phosphate synthase pdxT subunit